MNDAFLLVITFVFLMPTAHLIAATATPATPATQLTLSKTAVNDNPTANLIYQQLFTMQSQLASLNEKLQQQKLLKSDIEQLETALQNLKTQLVSLQTKIDAQEKRQEIEFANFGGRIGDTKDSFNWWFFTLTILIAFGGFIVYKHSKKEAQTIAQQNMEDFIRENADSVLEKAQTKLENQLRESNSAVDTLHQYLQEARQVIAEKRKEVENAADEVQKAITEKQEATPESLKILENSTKKIDKKHASAQEYLSLASVSNGNKHYREALKWLNHALNVLDEEEKLSSLHAKLLFNKAVVYWRLEEPDNEIEIYNELIKSFAESSEENIQVQVARTMLNKAVTLGALDKPQEEIDTYDLLINRFSDSEVEAVQAQVARALVNKGITLGTLEKPQVEIDTYDLLINRFSDSEVEAVQAEVASGLVNKGVTLGTLEKPQEEIDTYDLLINRFSDSELEEVQAQVARALLNKGLAYGQMEKPQEAIDTFNLLIDRFSDSDSEQIQEVVTASLANLAELALLLETSEQVLMRVTKVEENTNETQTLAVMQFIRFMLENKTIIEVFSAIAAIPDEIKLTWSFSEIKDYIISNFESKKLEQIQAIITYFEDHQDLAILKNKLGLDDEAA